MSSSSNAVYAENNNVPYLIVLAGIFAALHIWKLPPALPDLQKELGLTLVESGFLLSLVQIGGMTLGLLIGVVAEKIGLRRCVLIGLGLLSVASAGGTIFDSKFSLFFFRGVEGCGFLMVVMPGPALIRRLVRPAHLSRVLGVWGCYIPVGSVIALLGGSWLLSVANWRVLWLLLVLTTLVMWVLIWRIVPCDRRINTPEHAAQGKTLSVWAILKTTLGSANVWLVALSFGVYAGQWIAVIGFLPTIYMLSGISGTTAGILTAVVAGANGVGTWVAGRLLHAGAPAHRLLATGFMVMGITAFLAFGVGLSATAQFFAILIFSLIGGLIPTTLFLLAIELAPSPQTTSTSLGWMLQVSALGQFFGPPLVAWVVTFSGGWQSAWIVMAVCCTLGIVMAMRLGRGR